MRRLFAPLFAAALTLALALGVGSPAAAQNFICPTAPPGTNNEQCASTAFVNLAASSILGTANTWTMPQTFAGGIAGPIYTLHGVNNTGVDDSTGANWTAIKANIAAVAAAGGGTIIVPCGVYSTLNAIPHTSNVSIVGEAPGCATIRAANESMDNVIGNGYPLYINQCIVAAKAISQVCQRLSEPGFLSLYTEAQVLGVGQNGYGGYGVVNVRYADLIIDGNQANRPEGNQSFIGAVTGTFQLLETARCTSGGTGQVVGGNLTTQISLEPSTRTGNCYGPRFVGTVTGTFLQGETYTCTSGGSGRVAYLYTGAIGISGADATGTCNVGNTVTGGTSGATLVIASKPNGDTLTGQTSGATLAATDNVADDAFQNNITFNSGVSRAVLENNTIINSVFEAVNIYGQGYDFLVDNNRLWSNCKAGTIYTAGCIQINVAFAIEKVTVSRNLIVGPTAVAGYCILVAGPGGPISNVDIDGNTIYGCDGDAIRIGQDGGSDTVDTFSVRGNRVYGITAAGAIPIRIHNEGSGFTQNGIVAGNRITGSNYGIYAQSNTRWTSIVGNSIVGANAGNSLFWLPASQAGMQVSGNASDDSGTQFQGIQQYINQAGSAVNNCLAYYNLGVNTQSVACNVFTSLSAGTLVLGGAGAGGELCLDGSTSGANCLTVSATGGVLGLAGPVSLTLGSDATGDMFYRNSAGDLARLPIGTTGQVLAVSGGLPAWAATSGTGTVNTCGTAGALAYYNTTGTTVSCDADTGLSAGTLTLGSSTFGASGAIDLVGSTSGTGIITVGTTGGVITIAGGLVVQSAFTATGLVTNADLANAATTVNGQTCTLGSTCTVTAAATGITVGTTTVTGGTANGLLYDNASVLGNIATANSAVLGTSSGGVPSFSTTLPSGLTAPSLTVTTAFTATGLVTLADLATQAANTVLVNATSGTASPTAQAVSSCSAAADALIWTTNTGFGCNTSINAATLGGATFAAPGAIGGTTASTGAFTTLTLGASGTVGTLAFGNATSGTVTLGTVTGALGSVTASLPANTGVIAELNLAQTWTAGQTISSTSANAFDVGANGATNPVLQIDDSTTSVATGLHIQGAAAGAGLTLSVISSGTNEGIIINPKGTGTVAINSNSSGGPAINLNSTYTPTAGAGPVIYFNSLNSASTSVHAAYINCGLYPTITAGSETGICDFDVLGPSGANNIITMGTISSSSGCFLCSGNSDNFWTLGQSGYAFANFFSHAATITGTLTANAVLTSPASGNAIVTVNAPTTSNQGDFDFEVAGALKWQFGMDANQNFFVYDAANALSVLTVNHSTQGTILGETGGSVAVVGTLALPGITSSSSAQTGTLCWTTGGGVTYDPTLACLSSLRALKDDIQPIDGPKAFAAVMGMEPVSYVPKYDGVHPANAVRQPGFIAEDVAALGTIGAWMTARDEDGNLRGVRYAQSLAVVTAAFQEHVRAGDNLEKRVNALETCMRSARCRLLGMQ
jgi:hypothetical protein